MLPDLIRKTLGALTLLWCVGLRCGVAWSAQPGVLLPEVGLRPEQLAVVVNIRDELSRQIGEYYVKRHQLPRDNLLTVAFDPDHVSLEPGTFAVLRRGLERKLPPGIQAYLLTWAQPYRVGCMSITSAFAFGYSRRYCAKGCRPTAESRYVSSAGLQPYTELGIRPAMMLAADAFDDARALIDRGADSIGWYYRGDEVDRPRPAAYLVETSDPRRNVRKVFFPDVDLLYGDRIAVHIAQTEAIEGATDVMFYLTGDEFIDDLDSNRFLPGAIGDHLTSGGGKLTDSRQMSAMAWLQAGATGSYGTVVEPCNLVAKFPNPLPLIHHYLAGRTLLEAYWKSVRMPGQGVFIGDPLAAPFRGYRIVQRGDALEVETAQLLPGAYKLLAADNREGPWRLLTSGIEIGEGLQHIALPRPHRPWYKLQRLQSLGDFPPPSHLPPPPGHLLSPP